VVKLAGVCKRAPAVLHIKRALRLLRAQREAPRVVVDRRPVCGVHELAALSLRSGAGGR
jgi:hypothetical protein